MEDFRNNIDQGKKARATDGGETPDQSRILGLVVRATEGDLDAFGELYSIYLDRIYRYIFYQVKDKMTAEDITEEVFVKAWKAVGSCKGREQTFSSWLYRIAHNQTIDNLRHRQRHPSIEIEDLDGVSDAEPGAEEGIERQELLDIIDCLPPNQSQVIILKFIEGMDNTEIGQVMGKRPGAIRILQMRALATLRQKLSTEN